MRECASEEEFFSEVEVLTNDELVEVIKKHDPDKVLILEEGEDRSYIYACSSAREKLYEIMEKEGLFVSSATIEADDESFSYILSSGMRWVNCERYYLCRKNPEVYFSEHEKMDDYS